MATRKRTQRSSRAANILAGLFLAAVLGAGLLYTAAWAASPESRTRMYSKLPYSIAQWVPLTDRMAPLWIDLEPGIRMELDPHDLVSNRLLVNGEWEKEAWDRIEARLPRNGVFADVGAHIGYYSLKAAKKVGPDGVVLAVEPNPETLARLRANLDASAVGKTVRVAPVACSDREATLEFFAAPRANTGESSLSHKNASQEGEVAHSYQVRARPLDDIVEEAGIQRLDVVKIDVEGADFLVLKGAERTIERFHPVLYVETVDKQLKEMGSSVAELTALVVAHGYKANVLPGGNTEFLPLK